MAGSKTEKNNEPESSQQDLTIKNQEKLKSLITSTRPLEETQAALESASKENKVVLTIN